MSRRRYLVGAGSAVAASSGALYLTTDNASATVAVESLDVANAEYVLTDEAINDIRLYTNVAWSWDGNADATAYELRLKVGSSASNAETITTTGKESLGKAALTGQTELQGSIFNTSVFDPSHFTPTNGEIQTSLVVLVEFDVIREGEVAESAQATDTATITVRKEELSYTVELAATGEFTITSE